MKTEILPVKLIREKLTKTRLKFFPSITSRLLSRARCLGAVILICSSASAQNLLVSGTDSRGGEIFEFSWDAKQSIFASGLTEPWDLAFDSAGNLFVVDYDRGGLFGEAAIYKITPHGARTTFASGLSYPSDLAPDKAGNLFVADYDHGIIYEYKPNGSRGTFASGLYHPVGPAFDSLGNLFVADNNIGNIHQGGIYEYKPNGSRATFAVLGPSDRPTDLAFDNTGNLFVADRGGNIYKYDLGGVLRRQGVRTTFGSVPNSAQSLAWDNAGNLLVVNAGDAKGDGHAIYKFTQQGVRTTFAPVGSGSTLRETFSHVAFQPMPCCP
jgi:sugar lactone lactonase YvrE